MTWVRTTEISEPRSVHVTSMRQRKYTRAWRVEFDAAINSGGEATLRVPVRRFDPYVEPSGNFFDFRALAMELDGRPEDAENCFNWIVVAQYDTTIWEAIVARILSGGKSGAGTPPQDQPTGDGAENPLNHPASVSWGDVPNKRVQNLDNSAPPKAWINSAGDPADPAFEVDEPDTECVIEKNIAVYSENSFAQFRNKLNQNSCRIGNDQFDPLQVRCVSITAATVFEHGYTYWKMRVVLHIRNWKDDGFDYWDFRWLDAGTHQMVAGVRSHILDAGGLPVTNPVPLNGSGGKLSDSDALAGNVAHRTNKPFKKMSMDTLFQILQVS